MTTIYNIDHMLPPSSQFIEPYSRAVKKGIEYLRTKKIIFLCLARNLATKIENNLNRLCVLGDHAQDYKILLFENDSEDNTKEIIQNIAQNNNRILYESHTLNRLHYGPTKETARTTALAEYRNFLRLKVSQEYNNYDYVIVCDIDFNDISSNGFYNSFGWFSSIETIDAIAGNAFELKHMFGSPKPILWNYDSWAFRYTWWNELSIQQQQDTQLQSYDPMMWFGFFIPPVGSPLIPTNSAFGGMAIYKTQKYITGKYSGHDCEHVCFHADLQHKYQVYNLYLNPSQIMLV